MGNRTTQDIAEQAKDGSVNLEIALNYHFRVNHYPPLPLSLIPVAIQIIRGEVKGIHVRLPEGVTWRGLRSAPVSECISAWHLSPFMLNPDDWSDDE